MQPPEALLSATGSGNLTAPSRSSANPNRPVLRRFLVLAGLLLGAWLLSVLASGSASADVSSATSTDAPQTTGTSSSGSEPSGSPSDAFTEAHDTASTASAPDHGSAADGTDAAPTGSGD